MIHNGVNRFNPEKITARNDVLTPFLTPPSRWPNGHHDRFVLVRRRTTAPSRHIFQTRSFDDETRIIASDDRFRHACHSPQGVDKKEPVAEAARGAASLAAAAGKAGPRPISPSDRPSPNRRCEVECRRRHACRRLNALHSPDRLFKCLHHDNANDVFVATPDTPLMLTCAPRVPSKKSIFR